MAAPARRRLGPGGEQDPQRPPCCHLSVAGPAGRASVHRVGVRARVRLTARSLAGVFRAPRLGDQLAARAGSGPCERVRAALLKPTGVVIYITTVDLRVP